MSQRSWRKTGTARVLHTLRRLLHFRRAHGGTLPPRPPGPEEIPVILSDGETPPRLEKYYSPQLLRQINQARPQPGRRR